MRATLYVEKRGDRERESGAARGDLPRHLGDHTCLDLLHMGLLHLIACVPLLGLRTPPPPTMMASPLRVRERTGKALSWARGAVVSTQNVVIERVPVVNRMLGARVGRGDDDNECPAVLSEDICLVPGNPIVRVEAAPGNARRIFTGIDIVAECPNVLELVWGTLTDYENLAEAVPNLVENKVLSYDPRGGARLEQVGAAKLAPGVTFKATTTLDVREYFDGLPAKMEADHLVEDEDESADSEKQSTDSAAVRRFGSALPLTADVFPRPYCISSMPRRDITMQGVQDVGDFRFYQGVWRMQELPGCAPPGASAMRLTYSVELSPRLWVPVALLEGRIASALGENLEAIRDYVVAMTEAGARGEEMAKA